MYPYTLFLDVTLYDIFLCIGVVMALVVFYLYSGKLKIKSRLQLLVLGSAVVAIAVGFVAAILTQSIYNYIETGTFRFEGMTFYGGLIGGAITFLLAYFLAGHFVFRKTDTPRYHLEQIWTVVDVAACSILVAHAFGRIGCLTAGCCHGAIYSEPHPCTVPIRYVSQSNVLLETKYMVPVQLFEALFLFVLFGVFTLCVLKKKRFVLPLYMILYGVWRFFIEYARADDRGKTFIPFLTPSQLTAVILVLGGAALLIYEIRKFRRKEIKQ